MYIIDIIISVLQSMLFVFITMYCLDMNRLINSKKVICIILLTINGSAITYIFGNFSICIFVVHIMSMIIILLFFRKRYTKAMVAYSLIYSIVAIWIFIFGNLLYGIFNINALFAEYINIINIGLLYISQLVLIILCFKFINKIKQIYTLLSHEKISISYGIVLGFLPDFLISLYLISYDKDNVILSDIIFVALFIFLGFSIMIFSKIVIKAKEISELNIILASKNKELKNIKHDYGLQMSCLYELADMDKYDDVANLLKSIINQNGTNMTDNSRSDVSLLSLATRHVIGDDIKMILDDKANYKLTTISEIELYRIIINIVNNAIKAMKNKGTLVAKSFEDLKNIIITIENDGEKIPEEIIGKIFNVGFTTKNDNHENHGYGLSIVKDLLKDHNGNIFVESNNDITRFTITLPLKEYI